MSSFRNFIVGLSLLYSIPVHNIPERAFENTKINADKNLITYSSPKKIENDTPRESMLRKEYLGDTLLTTEISKDTTSITDSVKSYYLNKDLVKEETYTHFADRGKQVTTYYPLEKRAIITYENGKSHELKARN